MAFSFGHPIVPFLKSLFQFGFQMMMGWQQSFLSYRPGRFAATRQFVDNAASIPQEFWRIKLPNCTVCLVIFKLCPVLHGWLNVASIFTVQKIFTLNYTKNPGGIRKKSQNFSIDDVGIPFFVNLDHAVATYDYATIWQSPLAVRIQMVLHVICGCGRKSNEHEVGAVIES